MKRWFDHIMFHTRLQPQRPAIVMQHRAVTYGMLATGIDRCARRLVALKVGTADPVAILVKSPLRQMVLCLALFRIGVPSISLEQEPADLKTMKLGAVLRDSGAATPANAAHRFLEVSDEWFGSDPPGSGALPEGFSDSRQVCRLSLTSGSTGASKLFVDTIESIGERTFSNYFGGMDVCQNGVLCMPGLSTTFGFGNCCATLAAGRTLYFAESADEAIALIALVSIDFMVASTEQVLVLSAIARRSGASLPSLRRVVMGGSVPTRVLLEAAMIYLCKEIQCQYGATEIGLIARASARDVLTNPGLVGYVVPDVEVGTFMANGERSAPGEIGSIKVRRARDGHSDAIAQAAGERNRDAWAELGDWGSLTPDGRLYVVGRAADGRIAGPQISPAHEVEHVLRLECELEDVAAIVIDEGGATSKPQVWIGAVKMRDARLDRLEALLRNKGVDCGIRLFDLKHIPRGMGGKVNREQLKSLLLMSAAVGGRS